MNAYAALAKIEANLGEASANLTGKAAEEFEEFQSGWPNAKELTAKLAGASAEHPASAKELLAHFEAFELDDSIDEALEALAKSANPG